VTLLTIGPLADADLPRLAELTVVQETRWHAADARLAGPRDRREIASWLTAHRPELQNEVVVVRDAGGLARGYMQPTVFEVAADSDLLAYFTARNGTFSRLVLPAPGEVDAGPACAALLDALVSYGRRQQTMADVVAWPSADSWVVPLLAAAGFQAAHTLTHRSLEPQPGSARMAVPGLQARPARRSDEDALVDLHLANVAHDATYSPFIGVVPTLEPALRAKLGRLWAGGGVEDGVPLVLVVDQAGTLVGMAETYLEADPGYGVAGSLPPSRYAYLDQVYVRPEWRGKGVGRLLFEEVARAFVPQAVAGYALYFSAYNPLASAFWPHLGFRPVLTIYMRQASDIGA
jgi:GNAT superfamily N-acetyltransferase